MSHFSRRGRCAWFPSPWAHGTTGCAGLPAALPPRRPGLALPSAGGGRVPGASGRARLRWRVASAFGRGHRRCCTAACKPFGVKSGNVQYRDVGNGGHGSPTPPGLRAVAVYPVSDEAQRPIEPNTSGLFHCRRWQPEVGPSPSTRRLLFSEYGAGWIGIELEIAVDVQVACPSARLPQPRSLCPA